MARTRQTARKADKTEDSDVVVDVPRVEGAEVTKKEKAPRKKRQLMTIDQMYKISERVDCSPVHTGMNKGADVIECVKEHFAVDENDNPSTPVAPHDPAQEEAPSTFTKKPIALCLPHSFLSQQWFLRLLEHYDYNIIIPKGCKTGVQYKKGVAKMFIVCFKQPMLYSNADGTGHMSIMKL
jgi:hypothetical protein